MASRKRLQNKETFKFEENDVLPLKTGSGRKKSVQERLVPKAGGARRPTEVPRAGAEGENRLGKNVKPGGQSVVAPSVPINNNNYKKGQDPSLDNIVAKLKSGLILGKFPAEEKGDVGPTNACHFCERSIKMILCSLCGNTTTGRIATRCPSHPRKVFLQNLSQCPACRQGGLNNLVEFDLPQGMEESLKKIKEIK